MEINVLEESKDKIVFEIKGEGHAFCNVLRSELNKNKKVKNAGYAIEHPLVGVPKFVLETDGADPRTVLQDAMKSLKKDIASFKKDFEKAVK